MHTNDRRVYNLTDSTFIALDLADVISLEVDIFSIFNWADTRLASVPLNYDNEGEPYTNSNKGTATSYGDEDGMPQPLDAFFQQFCHNSGKLFEPLESVEFQKNLLISKSFRPDWSRVGFESMIRDQEQILELYLAGDIYSLDNLLKKTMNLYPKLYDEVIVKRNFGMADKLDSLFQNQVVFCAVGAGHLAGGAGIISLLRRKGYKVRKVIASYSENERTEEQKVKSFRTYQYDNDTLGVHAIFPGMPIEGDNKTDKEDQLHIIYRDLGQGNTFEIEVFYREEDQNLDHIAKIYIASPSESPYEKIVLDTGDEAYQGLGETYRDGTYWIRVIMGQDVFIVMKAYGGNKFMNSTRAFHFFDQVWID